MRLLWPLITLVFFSIMMLSSCKGGEDDGDAEPLKAPGIARCVEGDCLNGRGVKIEASGERYEGEWQMGARSGVGIAAWPDGATYIGQWSGDQPHGRGVYIKSNGEKYEGEWEKGKRQGRGTARWPDGSSYTGDFKNDMSHGNGIFTDVSGARYEGQFQDGKAHGRGVLTTPDGKKVAGRWHEGRPPKMM